MKHAGTSALARLAPLLAQLRAFAALKERSPAVFYFRSRAYLHFHEDPAGLFADIRAADGQGFDRLEVSDEAGRAALLRRAAEQLEAHS